jgi:hypothetical protein
MSPVARTFLPRFRASFWAGPVWRAIPGLQGALSLPGR